MKRTDKQNRPAREPASRRHVRRASQLRALVPADFAVQQSSNIVLVTPKTRDASLWLVENTQAEPWQWMGLSLAVDARVSEPLVNAIATL